jgi:hypothetical protein
MSADVDAGGKLWQKMEFFGIFRNDIEAISV